MTAAAAAPGCRNDPAPSPATALWLAWHVSPAQQGWLAEHALNLAAQVLRGGVSGGASALVSGGVSRAGPARALPCPMPRRSTAGSACTGVTPRAAMRASRRSPGGAWVVVHRHVVVALGAAGGHGGLAPHHLGVTGGVAPGASHNPRPRLAIAAQSADGRALCACGRGEAGQARAGAVEAGRRGPRAGNCRCRELPTHACTPAQHAGPPPAGPSPLSSSPGTKSMTRDSEAMM